MVVGELLWFLRGDTDVKFLNENKIGIWNKDAYNWYVKHHSHNDPGVEGLVENEDGSFRMMTFEEFSAKGVGSVGKNYSYQWRNFGGKTDQIRDLIRDMKQDIMSSRLKVNAWNPSEIFETALPPCHSEFQVIGVPLTLEERQKFAGENFSEISLNALGIPEFGFELHWNQRSVDTFLGLPFNVASYGLLAKILEQLTGFPALGIEGTLKCVHFYDNQYEAVKQMVSRDPNAHGESKLCILQKVGVDYKDQDLDEVLANWGIGYFSLENYTADAEIRVEMLAPKN